MMNVDDLNDKFGIEGEVGFSEMDGELVYLSVWNKYGEADICLYGAHVTHYQPADNFEVFYMSPDSEFEVGKPIRGGIPVCFPWFGPHVSDASLPVHGFARLMYWDVLDVKVLPEGETLVQLGLASNAETKAYWPYDFSAELTLVVGRKLGVRLKVTNTGSEAFTYTSALHSYFNISAIEHIQIEGLKDTAYYNGFETELHHQTIEMLTITEETNRRYINAANACGIHDPAFFRTIVVEKAGSNVTVVWNPWEETAKKIGDLPDDGYHAFVCVEAVNAYNDAITLNPGQNHITATAIAVDSQKKGSKAESNVLILT
jgi:glucose-6-phosphate 1-epimerase